MEQELNDKSLNKYMFMSLMFITLLIASNLLAVKIMSFGSWITTPATFTYPFTFILGNIITELYGIKNFKKVIFAGFLAEILLTFFMYTAIFVPYPASWEGQEAFKMAFMFTPQILIGSLIAYAVGELLNSGIASKIKEITKGKLLWLRTLSGTVIGQIFDTIIFYAIAFFARVPFDAIVQMIILDLSIKVLVQLIFGTPLSYLVVKKIWKK